MIRVPARGFAPSRAMIPAMGTKGSSTAWKVQKGMSFAARMARGSPAPQTGAAAAHTLGYRAQ